MPLAPATAARFFHPATSLRGRIERDGNLVSLCCYKRMEGVATEQPNVLHRSIVLHLDDETAACQLRDTLVDADGNSWELQDMSYRKQAGVGRIYDCKVNEVRL